MEKMPFGFMNPKHRPGKPRESGITMMIDWGMGVRRQEDILNIAGPYIDIAKIAVGLSGIISERVLKEKLRIYADFQVGAFIGGQFLEFGIFHQGLGIAHRYFEEASSVGFRRSVVYGLSTLRVVGRFLLHRTGLRRSAKLRPRVPASESGSV